MIVKEKVGEKRAGAITASASSAFDESRQREHFAALLATSPANEALKADN
jgi:hypothetical protein